MRKVIVNEWMTLDGVVQAPGYADEDTTGGVAEAVAGLKREDGGDLHVIGSTQLVHTLAEHDLVDAYRVMIDPVVVGGGKRVFRDDGVLRPLRLEEHQVTTTGAILATYTVDHQ